MRSDQECEAAVVARNVEALRQMPARELLAAMQVGPRTVDCLLQCTYLGIMTDEPARLAAGGELRDLVMARVWQPKSAEEVGVVREPLLVQVELFGSKTGAPALHILPGPYPAVCHPHVEPLLPGFVCLTDDWQPETMTAATLCRSLAAMLRFEAGTWSLDPGRPVAPGIAEWLGGAGAEAFEFPLKTPPGRHRGIRILDAADEEAAE